MARAIEHLVNTQAPYGTYNVTGSGPVTTWRTLRGKVTVAGYDPGRVIGVSTEEYFASAVASVAPRPQNSALDLAKVASTGFSPAAGDQALETYVKAATQTKADARDSR